MIQWVLAKFSNILSLYNMIPITKPQQPLTIHNSLDSDDEFCSGCRNVSKCHHKQSFTTLTRTIILYQLMIMTPGFKPLTVKSQYVYNTEKSEQNV